MEAPGPGFEIEELDVTEGQGLLWRSSCAEWRVPAEFGERAAKRARYIVPLLVCVAGIFSDSEGYEVLRMLMEP